MISRISTFWLVNTLGWTLFILINMIIRNSFGVPLNRLELISNIASFFSALLITGFYRRVLHRFKTQQLHPLKLIIPILCGAVITGFCMPVVTFSLTKLVMVLLRAEFSFTWQEILGNTITIGQLMLFWTVTYFAWDFFRRMRHSERLAVEAQLAQKDAQLNLLRTQINPHFMFNALNNIRALILENPHSARDMLTYLADLLRYSLASGKHRTVSLQTELEVVKDFAALCAIQFEDRLSWEWEIDEQAMNIQMPPMLIQLLVENGIKHGISHQAVGGHISVTAKIKQQILHIAVRNTGQLKAHNEPGLGLINIKQRLQLLYENNASFKLYEADETVIAEIELPIKTENEPFS